VGVPQAKEEPPHQAKGEGEDEARAAHQKAQGEGEGEDPRPPKPPEGGAPQKKPQKSAEEGEEAKRAVPEEEEEEAEGNAEEGEGKGIPKNEAHAAPALPEREARPFPRRATVSPRERRNGNARRQTEEAGQIPKDTPKKPEDHRSQQ
jgi:hypothetical protein